MNELGILILCFAFKPWSRLKSALLKHKQGLWQNYSYSSSAAGPGRNEALTAKNLLFTLHSASLISTLPLKNRYEVPILSPICLYGFAFLGGRGEGCWFVCLLFLLLAEVSSS